LDITRKGEFSRNMENEMKEYTVGQEVGYGRYGGYGSAHSTGFGEITKINGHGHITVKRTNGMTIVFDKHGNERGTNYGTSLIDADYLRKVMADDLKRNTRHRAISDLIQKLSDCRGHSGISWMNKETKAELLEMLEAIETTD